MNWCLLPSLSNKFKSALKDGTIDPFKMSNMSPTDRHAFIKDFFGDEEIATNVNALFESKLLLKNQKAGYISWAKKVGGITKQARQDLYSKIDRLDKVLSPEEGQAFLNDLADTKLGFGVTEQQAETITNLSKSIRELKTKANLDFTFTNLDDKAAIGWQQVELKKFVDDIKLQSKSVSFREQPVRKVFNIIGEVPGALKSSLSSLDNSFHGRQGIFALLDPRTSKIWAQNFIESFNLIGKELKGQDAMDAVHAYIYSSPNSLSGKYRALGKGSGLDVLSEEAFPTLILERIPAIGRLFKASASAYNGSALMLRARLADRLITNAEKFGVNTLSKKEMEPIGNIIGAITGRGSLGKAEPLAKELNTLMFSVKFFKSNVDKLLAPAKYGFKKAGAFGGFENKGEEFALREAATNTMSAIGTIAGVLTVATILDPNSTELDPRSSNFGKIKMFGHWTDITGGTGSLITLAARLVPTMHNGKWGLWSKSRTGVFTDLTAGAYGQTTGMDIVENLFEGKLSPTMGIVRDVLTGQTYSGKPVRISKPSTLLNLAPGLQPIPLQQFEQIVNDKNKANTVGTMIMDLMGFSVSTNQYSDNWTDSPTKAQTAFLAQVGQKNFQQANDLYNKTYNDWQAKIIETPAFKKLSDKDKTSTLTKQKAALQKAVFNQYGFVQ